MKVETRIFAVAALFAFTACGSEVRLAPLGADARAEKWLVVGEWSGKAGFSLNGLGTENDIRPCEGDPVYCQSFDSGRWTNWTAVAHVPGMGYLVKETGGNASWAKSVSYGALWVVAEDACEVGLPAPKDAKLELVDVIGRVRAIAPDADGKVRLKVTGSPVYLVESR